VENFSKKVNFLGVQVDLIPDSDFERVLLAVLESGSGRHIVFIRSWDIIKSKYNKHFREYLNQASLVIPITNGLRKNIQFVCREEAYAYMPFSFIIKTLGILDQFRKSVYILGAKPEIIQRSANNLRTSFPNLNIVGRCSGKFPKTEQENILTAIKKASPSMLILGSHLPRKALWAYDIHEKLNAGIILWSKDIFEIFAGTKKRPSNDSWEKGNEWFIPSLLRPWKWLKIFPYVIYGIALLFSRKKKK
jgi:N-acetylglucosaminyldiphosphoundecaprenol N-acetyl-beta-D-mannosaminyltransferase